MGTTNMMGFMQPQPNNYASFSGYGSPTQINPMTGIPDHLSMLTPTLSSVDTSGIDMGSGAGPSDGIMASLGQWFKDSGMVGTKDAPGWGGMALGTAGGLANAFLAMKQYGIAKDTLNENKRQFGLNFDAQRQTTNSALEDRQRARVASNPGAYQSVGSYMAQNGIGG